jgi:predicted Rossmann fold flavoprotein
MASFYPRGHRALIGPLHHFGVLETVRWFESRGVRLKTESDGRMFPTTDDSQTVMDCLQDAAAQAGVVVRTTAVVKEIARVEEGCGDNDFVGFELVLHGNERLRARKILLASGGTRSAGGANLARTLGHKLAPAVPSLFTFHIDDPRITGLSGLSVEQVEVHVVGEDLASDGPLLVTHWGMSGPAILKLSAWGARELSRLGYAFTLGVNWAPGVDVAARFHQLRREWGKRQVATRSPFDAIPKRLWEKLVAAAGIPSDCRWAELSKARSRALGEHLTRARFSVNGKSTNKDEFVTCGGVPTDEVDMRTMESRLAPGVYFAGEILDIDGVTGGFNFQNAWTTAHLAGRAMAAELAE